MLVPHELYQMHDQEEFISFVRLASSDRQSLADLTRYFDKWHLKNRRQLHTLYDESPDKEKHATFIGWAREHFYMWAFNQEKKSIDSEIAEMVRTV